MAQGVIIQESYAHLVARVKKKYFSIGSVNCPSFPGEKVLFKPWGFRHFFYDTRDKPRNTKETRCRLNLFERALSVIINPPSAFTYGKKMSKKGRTLHYWSLKCAINATGTKKMTVIITSKTPGGAKQYFDVIPKWHKHTKRLP